MTRRTGGSFGDLPGMFLLVLFRYLSVILKCLCLVSLNCVFGLRMGKLGLHCATSQMVANSVFFSLVGGWMGAWEKESNQGSKRGSCQAFPSSFEPLPKLGYIFIFLNLDSINTNFV